jgi:hypothetical protein
MRLSAAAAQTIERARSRLHLHRLAWKLLAQRPTYLHQSEMNHVANHFRSVDLCCYCFVLLFGHGEWAKPKAALAR